MPFEIRKISNHGVSHPVVARLGVQTTELIGFANISQDARDALVTHYMTELKPRLLKCHDIFQRLLDARAEAMKPTVEAQSQGQITEVPNVIGLRDEAETFLYEAKNYFRETTRVPKLFFGDEFSDGLIEASSYFDSRSGAKSALEKWAENKFGVDDGFTEMLRSERAWTEEIIRKRNAVEHPGGNSGTLKIYNIERSADGLIPPLWQREPNGEKTDLYKDIAANLEDMLRLGEDLLVASITKITPNSVIEFYEIPESERRVEIPQRIGVQISKAVRAKMGRSDGA